MIQRLLKPSITRRMFFEIVLAFVLVWLVVNCFLFYRAQSAYSGDFDRFARGIALAAATAVDAQPDDERARIAASTAFAINEGLAELLRLPRGFLALQLWAADGRLLYSSAPASTTTAGFDRDAHFDISLDGKDFRGYAVWTPRRQHKLIVLESKSQRSDILKISLFDFESVLPLLVAFPLVLGPAWFAVFAGLKPLRELSKELASRKSGHLEPLSSRHVYTELAPVINEFNRTLARLKTLLQHERDFVANAAHELRTPLALITAQSDTLINAHGRSSREAAAQRLGAGLMRASRLVNQLLMLARLDANAFEPSREIDLADMARESLAALAGEALARGIELAYVGRDGVVATIPTRVLESVLDNLIGNAIRHGKPDGQVIVNLEQRADNELVLEVSDDGPGIPVSERARVFERFHRGGVAKLQGTGLGLAIVASAVRQLGGSIHVLSGIEGRGVCFTVRWMALRKE